MIYAYLAGVVLFGLYLGYLIYTSPEPADALDCVGLVAAALCWPITLPLFVLTYLIGLYFDRMD